MKKIINKNSSKPETTQKKCQSTGELISTFVYSHNIKLLRIKRNALCTKCRQILQQMKRVHITHL